MNRDVCRRHLQLVWVAFIAGCGHDESVPSSHAAKVASLPPAALQTVATRLPTAHLLDNRGDSVQLEFPREESVVLLLLDEDDCFSCIDLVRKSWQAHNWVKRHHTQLAIVVKTSDFARVRTFERSFRLPVVPFADTTEWTDRHFGLASTHPLLAMVDRTGLVVSVKALTSRAGDLSDMPAYLGALARWPDEAPHVTLGDSERSAKEVFRELSRSD